MVKNIEFDDESIKIGGRPRAYNIFEAKYSKHKNLLYGYTEIPEQFTSLLPIIDFIVTSDSALKHYISFMEKLVFDDLYRIPPITFALIGFFHESNNILALFRKSNVLKLSTTQWYQWNPQLHIVEKSILLDYIYSFSLYSPSIYKPELINIKSPFSHPPIQYLNAPAFGGWQSVDIDILTGYEEYPLILPPNFFSGYEGSYSFKKFMEEDMLEESYSNNLKVYVSDVVKRRLLKFSKQLKLQKIILPIIYLLENKFNFIYLLSEAGKMKNVNSDIYEDDFFVIDILNRYRGSKLRVYFSLWNLKNYRKGYTMKINLNFQSFLSAYSRMFYEIRYGGKLLYSSSSKINIL